MGVRKSLPGTRYQLIVEENGMQFCGTILDPEQVHELVGTVHGVSEREVTHRAEEFVAKLEADLQQRYEEQQNRLRCDSCGNLM